MTVDLDQSLRRIARNAIIVSAVFTAVALVVSGLMAAVAVLGGAVLTIMSFLLLKRGTARMIDPGAPPVSRGRAVALVVGRYALLGFAAYVMIARLRLHPLGLLVGASSIVAAVTVETVFTLSGQTSRRPRP